MRILVVSSYYKPAYCYGGPVSSLSNSCEKLASLGVHVTVFSTDACCSERLNVKLSKPYDINGVEVYYFPLVFNGLSYFYSPEQGRAIKSQIRFFDIAIAETLWGYAFKPLAVECSKAGKPYVIPVRGQLLPWALKYKRWKKSLYLKVYGRKYIDRSAAIVCETQDEAEEIRLLGIKPSPVVIPNGIDLITYQQQPLRGYYKKQFGIPDVSKILLFLGRLHRFKRADLCIEALAGLKDTTVHLFIAGPDDQGIVSQLKRLAIDLGCQQRVHFTGLLINQQVVQLLADADLLLMPTNVRESFGMSALEALAAGVPTITSENVPVGVWAEKAGAGKITQCDAQAISRAIEELLNNPIELNDMSIRAQEFVKNNFDVSVIAKRTLELYRTIIDTGHPAISAVDYLY